jgi:integral membrane protein (TIGR01906 family)
MIRGDYRSRMLRILVIAVVAAALPVLFISGNVRVLVNSKQTYDYNWWRNGVEDRTGLSRRQLDGVGQQFRDYFNNREGYLLLTADFSSGPERLLTEREVLHMHDVKQLVRRVFAAEWAAAAIVVACVASGFALLRSRFWPLLQNSVTYSAVGTAAVIGVVGLAAAVDFDTTFTIFHEVSFSNDYWKLAYGNVLIQMYPEMFWFEAWTFALVLVTALEFAVAVIGIRWLSGRFVKNAVGPVREGVATATPRR